MKFMKLILVSILTLTFVGCAWLTEDHPDWEPIKDPTIVRPTPYTTEPTVNRTTVEVHKSSNTSTNN